MKFNYTIIPNGNKCYIRRTRYENKCMFDEYFTGYDFMGTANWTDSGLSNCIREMDNEEAEQIVKDLKAADDFSELPMDDEPTFTVTLTKDQVRKINDWAKINWEKAQVLLQGVNLALGTNFRWINKRVVFLGEDHGQLGWHDAYCWAKD